MERQRKLVIILFQKFFAFVRFAEFIPERILVGIDGDGFPNPAQRICFERRIDRGEKVSRLLDGLGLGVDRHGEMQQRFGVRVA